MRVACARCVWDAGVGVSKIMDTMRGPGTPTHFFPNLLPGGFKMVFGCMDANPNAIPSEVTGIS